MKQRIIVALILANPALHAKVFNAQNDMNTSQEISQQQESVGPQAQQAAQINAVKLSISDMRERLTLSQANQREHVKNAARRASENHEALVRYGIPGASPEAAEVRKESELVKQLQDYITNKAPVLPSQAALDGITNYDALMKISNTLTNKITIFMRGYGSLLSQLQAQERKVGKIIEKIITDNAG